MLSDTSPQVIRLRSHAGPSSKTRSAGIELQLGADFLPGNGMGPRRVYYEGATD